MRGDARVLVELTRSIFERVQVCLLWWLAYFARCLAGLGPTPTPDHVKKTIRLGRCNSALIRQWRARKIFSELEYVKSKRIKTECGATTERGFSFNKLILKTNPKTTRAATATAKTPSPMMHRGGPSPRGPWPQAALLTATSPLRRSLEDSMAAALSRALKLPGKMLFKDRPHSLATNDIFADGFLKSARLRFGFERCRPARIYMCIACMYVRRCWSCIDVITCSLTRANVS